jgi:hypothetical protein
MFAAAASLDRGAHEPAPGVRLDVERVPAGRPGLRPDPGVALEPPRERKWHVPVVEMLEERDQSDGLGCAIHRRDRGQ